MMDPERGRTPRLQRFLFAPLDPLSAALFRIALAAMVMVVFWPLPGPVDVGVTPVPGIGELVGIAAQAWYWPAILGLLILFGAGVWPRVVGLTLVALLLPSVLVVVGRQAGRHVLLFTLLAFCFVRSDARLSLRWLRVARGPRSAGPCWPVRLVQLQLSVLYGINAVAKMHTDFLSGETLAGMSMMLPNFQVDLSASVLDVGGWRFPVWLGAVGTVLAEAALALGFWFSRLRVATALFGVLFHIALTQIVRIGFLDVVSVFLYAAFLLPFDRRERSGA
jgi:hypothetical protein